MADLAESWNVLRQETNRRSHRLASEVADAWSHVQSLTQMLAERLQSQDPAEFQPASMESLERLFSALAERLLIEPLTLYRRKRPLLSVVSAIQEYEAGLEGVVQRLPVACKLSGRALLALPGAEGSAGWRKHWLRWRRSAPDIPLRAVVSGHLQRDILRRGTIDGACQLALARACLHLLGP